MQDVADLSSDDYLASDDYLPGNGLSGYSSPGYEALFEGVAQLRGRREELKLKISEGAVMLGEVWEMSKSDEAVADTKLLSLMDCVPNLGKVRGRRLLEDLGLADSVKLGEVTAEQQSELLMRLVSYGCVV